MIPSVLAAQVRRGVEEFLLTTFPVTNPYFAGRLEEFLQTPGALFRGPYVSLKLPFLSGDPTRRHFPEVVPPSFVPHRHQQQAWDRLASPGARSTLVATGTGSGKTECFLFPILDYCLQQRGRPGIKAIIVYPMNALATDQARRLARTIHECERLRGHVTAGLYIGGREGEEGPGAKQMTGDQVITDRDTLRLAPPDILLTNYKMLDYLLVRPADYPLWRRNEPETLKYVVVDELHTFDGAQGGDLACLIRRIKERVKAPAGHVCCVGTSATLGGDESGGPGDGSSRPVLLEYASEVFGEPFEADALIGETLQTADQFLAGHLVTRFAQPAPAKREEMDPSGYSSEEGYIRAQHGIWFDRDPGPMDDNDNAWREELSRLLKGHAFFRNLLLVLGNRAVAADALLDELSKSIPAFDHPDRRYLQRLLDSFLALVSEARVKGPAGTLAPLVQVRCQLWLRELRRMVGRVAAPGTLAFADDLKPEDLEKSLPLIHCRECGVMGWGALLRDGDPRLGTDLRAFYGAYFHFSPNVAFIYPGLDFTDPDGQRSFQRSLCPGCMRLLDGDSRGSKCPHCGTQGDALIPVAVPVSWRMKPAREGKPARREGVHDCPSCGGRNSLTILGSRAASLTAVIVAQLFSSPFNDDKKLLTFSDSVQDASHRAGFFGARTFQFNFRAALQQVVDRSGDLPLAELHDRFIDHWHGLLESDERFIATFLPSDMAWLQDYETMRETGSLPPGCRLLDLLHRRLDWEVWSEYGFDARIGRTLEKTGSSTLAMVRDRLDAAVVACLEPVTNELGVLRDLSAGTLRRFIAGLVLSLKNRGAMGHHELARYIDSGGNSYLLGKRLGQLYMPNFGKGSRAPAFVSSRPGMRFNTWVRSGANASATWFEDWAAKCFEPVHGQAGAYAREIFDLIVPGLVSAGVLFEQATPRGTVWGLDPALFVVTRRVEQLRCQACSFSLSVAAADAHLFDGAPCQRYRCHGRLALVPQGDDYYRRLYREGDVRRVFAQEHTGLLERGTRERIEAGFISNARPGDPNLLSCTPTLEMGINIGDLSSLALCSIPPKPSNYLQRVGRAGRRDGNAFVLAVANARPHDLFFFLEPGEMIQGQVEPPGCFINASAVLERQFTGYVFDRWVETGLNPKALPLQLRPVLDQVERGELKADSFPQTFLRFFETNRTSLEQGFLQMFGERLQPYARERLLAFARGDRLEVPGLVTRLMEGLHGQARERKSLRNKLRLLAGRMADAGRDPAAGDPERERVDELAREKSAINAIVHEINRRHLLNFFTDEGLLPNYAFPESGVVLRSVIYKKNAEVEAGEHRYTTRSYTYERPAAVAIAELAPANTFYVEGRRLLIDQVNLDLSQSEAWRFCDACNYMALEGLGEPSKTCPRCGSPLWSDEGQRRNMVRMRQVIATSSERESRSYDESDDREPEFFRKNLFVVKDDADITAAWAIDREDVPFGFEFFKKMTLREVNFGRERGEHGTIRIAGREVPDNPFVVCRACGKVRGVREPLDHAIYCTFRDQPEKQKSFEACYLYREFSSEAIRMLLPVAAFQADQQINSFVAALDLGLRRLFKGDPGHLYTTVYDEPIPGSDVRKRFLVLYDGVPGGTGYLKELMQEPDVLMGVFQRSYDVMAACPCQHDPEKDGCYRCLLAYRGRHHAENTSRRAAMELLRLLLDNREHLKQTDRIDRIRLNALLESELEGRFVEALRRLVQKDGRGQMAQQVVNGKAGWYLRVGTEGYLLEPQASLGLEHGVRVPSRADFLIVPERPEGGVRPVAVFTDGFEYHADPASGNQRLGLDTAQRLALARSRRFWSWSLAWDDVEEVLRSGVEPVERIGKANWGGQRRLLEHRDPQGLAAWEKLHAASSLAQLVTLLENPRLDWETYAGTLLASFLERGSCSAEWVRTARARLLDAVSLDDWPTKAAGEGCMKGVVRIPVDPSVAADGLVMAGLVAGPAPSIREGRFSHVIGSFRFCEEAGEHDPAGFKRAWRAFLHFANLAQFAPGAECVTSEGLRVGRYGRMLDETERIVEPREAATAMAAELLALVAPEARPVVEAVAASRLPLPDAGYELADDDGEIVGEAELAWPQLRVAVLTERQAAAAEIFTAAGWRPFRLAQLENPPAALFAALVVPV